MGRSLSCQRYRAFFFELAVPVEEDKKRFRPCRSPKLAALPREGLDWDLTAGLGRQRVGWARESGRPLPEENLRILHLSEIGGCLGLEFIDISSESLAPLERHIVQLDGCLQLCQAPLPIIDAGLDDVDACI